MQTPNERYIIYKVFLFLPPLELQKLIVHSKVVYGFNNTIKLLMSLQIYFLVAAEKVFSQVTSFCNLETHI